MLFRSEARKCWTIKAQDKVNGKILDYASRFLVVATGENSAGNIPEIVGLQSFPGEAIHSSSYKSGSDYVGKSVLVVGCGNSGFEISYDLAVHGANTSIVIRGPVCIQFHCYYIFIFKDVVILILLLPCLL